MKRELLKVRAFAHGGTGEVRKGLTAPTEKQLSDDRTSPVLTGKGVCFDKRRRDEAEQAEASG